MHQEFREVVGHPGYRVDRSGNVWTSWKRKSLGRYGCEGVPSEDWKLMKPIRSNDYGHLKVVFRGGIVKLLHRLVLEAFVGPCPEGMQCCHLDGNPKNNALSNLRWETQLANMADAIRHGTTAKGEKNPAAKLTRDDVLEIRRRLANGETQVSIAASKGVDFSNVSSIARGKTWKHV